MILEKKNIYIYIIIILTKKGHHHIYLKKSLKKKMSIKIKSNTDKRNTEPVAAPLDSARSDGSVLEAAAVEQKWHLCLWMEAGVEVVGEAARTQTCWW